MIRAFAAAACLSLLFAGQAVAADAKCTLGRLAELPVKMNGMRPMLDVKVAGQPTSLLIDTGAFFTSITSDHAQKIKMRADLLPNGLKVRGVGGESDFKYGSADLELGKAKLKSLDFLIGGPTFGSADGLLGQNIMGQLDVEIDLANGVVRFFKPENCKKAVLAYWASGKPFDLVEMQPGVGNDNHIYAQAKINGRPIKVLFDTGASVSTLRRSAAAKAGFSPTGAGVQSAGLVSGIGSEAHEAWVAPFQSFTIGSEEIKNTRLIVSDLGPGDVDMLIGADFFLSHRVYISNSQNKIYFTYNGGPVFSIERRPAGRIGVNAAAPAEGDKLADAGAYGRRGSAFAARGDYEKAVADFTQAIALEPDGQAHFLDRGRAYASGGRPRFAMDDANKAIELKPNDPDALVFRAQLNLSARRPVMAMNDLDAALKASPKDDQLRLQVGAIYLRAGEYDKAITEYDGWIAANKNDDHVAAILNARCWARAVSNRDLDKALADCNQALRERSKTSDVLDSRGLVHLRRGEYKEALADYDQALKLQPRSAWSLFGRGLVKQKLGRGAEAEADLTAARAINRGIDEDAKRYGLTPSV